MYIAGGGSSVGQRPAIRPELPEGSMHGACHFLHCKETTSTFSRAGEEAF